MDVAAYMLSCRERKTTRDETLSRLRASDWGVEPIVVLDRSAAARRPERHERGSLALLRRAAADKHPFILFFEDDLDFNRHLRRNLLAWPPLLMAGDGERPFFASLYNPVIRALWRDEARAHFVADPDAVYGSQAFLLSRASVRDVLSHWDEVAGMGDIKISRLATRRCPAHYHVPSLVQHVAGPSVIGGPEHHASDFDADWTAPANAGQRAPEVAVAVAAALRRINGVEGWLSEEEARLLVTSCLQSLQHTVRDAAAVVEIGSWHGRSTLVLATAVDLAGGGAQVVAIDPHAGELTMLSGRAREGPTFEAFRCSISRAGLDAVVRPVRQRSQDVDWRDPIAFLFVDGLHDVASVRADLARFAPAVVPGGRVAVHDYGVFDGVRTAVDAFVAAGGWRRAGAAGSLVVFERTRG